MVKVLRLSAQAMEQINALRRRGFEIYRAEVRYVVFWLGKEEEAEVPIVLPTIYLRRRQN
jgi:hypothetical protein